MDIRQLEEVPAFITNIGQVALRLLCCCTPAYEHEDTLLIETEAPVPGK